MAHIDVQELPLWLLVSIVMVGGTIIWSSYRAFRGPLSHIPGPTVSKWTNLRLQFAVLTGERVRYVHALHEAYGPIVRISPHEISLSDIAAAKTIYKVGGPFLKPNWYDDFTGNQPRQNLFSSVDFHEHSKFRKLLSSNFSEKWIEQMEPFIAKNTNLAVTRMVDEASQQGYTDTFKWFTFMATDVIGESSFGQSFEMLRTGKKDQYILDLETVGSKGTWRAEFPLFFKTLAKLPFGPAKEIYAIVQRMNSYAEESIQRYHRQLAADPDNVKPTLLTKEYGLVETGELPWSQLRRDAVSFIVAGTDTTALAATNAVWLLSHHPDIEQELVREVSRLPTDFTDADLQQIKLLQYVINETLRLRGSVAQALPRVVPPGGATFCGFYIPERAICGVQGYTMHRDPAVWAHGDQFDPYRWEEPTKAMKDSYYPFGGGSRVCIGMHFAQLELRHALANFYRAFEGGVRMSQVDGMSPDDMITMTNFLEPIKGKRCLMERRK